MTLILLMVKAPVAALKLAVYGPKTPPRSVSVTWPALIGAARPCSETVPPAYLRCRQADIGITTHSQGQGAGGMLHGLGVPVGQDVAAEGEVEGTCAHAGQGDLGDGAGAGDRLTWLHLADGEFAFGCEVGQEGLPAPPASLRRLPAPRQAGADFIFAHVLGWHFWWKRM
jgi:hypothetical protein